MIDSHCHLYIKNSLEQQDQLIKEAAADGISRIINIGIDIETSELSIDLAEKYNSLYCTVGIHPHDAKKLNEQSIEKLRQLAAHQKVVAIGEIGLDFYRNLSPRPLQFAAFEKQLELAIELKKPIVIHTRESLEETIEVVKKYATDLVGGVFHCFSGNADDAERVFELGFAVSFGGVMTFKNSDMAEVAAQVPLEKIILETDSPYLTPLPFRGKQNRPAYVKYVYQKLAELKNLPASEIETIIDRNCVKLFKLEETFAG
ncbi:MAG: TatD family hydrolase [candidate division Zixibacteria bacterium]|nr:TatD family hydrolase [candidate division Zixibacteria bacterium]